MTFLISSQITAWDRESGLYVTVTGGSLSLREAPGLDAPRIGMLSDGEALLVLERTAFAETIDAGSDGILSAPWYRVQNPRGKEGWCFGGFLVVPPAVGVLGTWTGEAEGIPGKVTLSIFPGAPGRLTIILQPGEGQSYTAENIIGGTQGLPYLLNRGRGLWALTKLSSTGEELNFTFTPPEMIGQLPPVKGVFTRVSWWPREAERAAPPHKGVLDLVTAGDAAALKAALDAGADPDFRDPESGKTALHLALAHPSRENLVAILLEAGADPNIRDARGDTPFALFLGTSRTIREVELVLRHGGDPNGRSGGLETDTPFVLAILQRTRSRGRTGLEMISLMLEYGADPNIDTGEYWVPGLAVDAGDRELMALLLDAGLKGSSKGFGTTLLEYARDQGPSGMAELIRE